MLADVGATGSGLTVTDVVAQVELPQLFSQRTQYCVVEVGHTTRLFPVPTEVPPQLPGIHLRVVPDPPVAVRVAHPPAQIGPLFDALVGATGNGLTVTATPDAQLKLRQPVVEFFVFA